jgi:hypothetical protein
MYQNNSHAHALYGYVYFTPAQEYITREMPKSFCSEQSQDHKRRPNKDVTEEVETAGSDTQIE